MSGKKEKAGYKRKTDHGNIDEDNLIAALKAIKVAKQSVRATANSYNIPRSTLQREIARLDATEVDIASMTDEDLKIFVKARDAWGRKILVKTN